MSNEGQYKETCIMTKNEERKTLMKTEEGLRRLKTHMKNDQEFHS